MKPHRALIAASAIAVAIVVTFSVQKEASAHLAAARSASALAHDSQLRRISIDILPRQKDNAVDLSTPRKAIEVAVLGEPGIAWGEIDPMTIEFAGAQPVKLRPVTKDVNGDNRADYTYQFETGKMNLTGETTEACFTASNTTNQKFMGCDALKVIPIP